MGLNELADELIEALEFGGHVEHKPEESLDEYRLKSMVVAIQMVTNMSFSEPEPSVSKRKRRTASDVDTSSSEHEDDDNDDNFASYGEPEKIVGTWNGSIYGPLSEISALDWLLSPMQSSTFFDSYFERTPFHISLGKSGRSRFSVLFSEEEIFSLLHQNRLRYGLDIDVTIVKGNVRKNYNYNKDPSAEEEHETADLEIVRKRYKKGGCSLRVLHPQRFSDELWKFMYLLECCWGSVVGCNAYLTPSKSQGFAPHFDDIDAFILQVSGRKRWKLHKSVSDSSVLPRYSSRDFFKEELSDPIFDQVLKPGDLLYLPRGVIHEAKSLDQDSLHVTISVNQRNNYFEFLRKAFSGALEEYAQECIDIRRTMPPLYFFQEVEELEGRVRHLLKETTKYVDVPAAVGKEFSEFMLNRLPPPPSLRSHPKTEEKVKPDSMVVLTYPGSAYPEVDISTGSPTLFVYHCLSNAREIHQTGNIDFENELDQVPPQLEVPLDCGFLLQNLLSEESTQLDTLDDTGASLSSVELAQALVDANILTVVSD